MLLDANAFKQLLTILLGVLLVLFIYFKWCYQFWKKRNVPFLEPSVPIGNFGSLLGDVFTKFYNQVKVKGKYACTFNSHKLLEGY